MARCFVTHDLPGPALGRLRAVHEVDLWTEPLPPTPDQLAERAADAEGLLSMLVDRIDDALLDRCPKLRAIANYAVGYDNIDLAATRARGILVGNTPDVLTDATADLTFALILAIARRLGDAAASVKDGEWGTWEPDNYLGYDVHGATLGIIGLGRIGHAVARRAAGFDMTVIHAGRDPAGLDDLLARADFVSVHCPLTPETRHLIDADALFKMRPTAMLINTARGPIVDQDALREALVDGTIAGAALDVTDPEPLPPDDPLMSAPNLIVVPHIGSATHQAREGMATLAVENLLA
ncbi:MAG TPA: D-glycerate dehydrogenase, partial [Solirubrobacteraceae bacterium]|nr:D-glycerate dehydrogenase [Solirubrobacteraceae bacterium]